MPSLYVPLDVGYFDDDKVIEAGPMAELLFVRSLAFAKRSDKRDGHISASQLSIVAARISRHRQLAERLVDVGLWERNGTGIYVAAWLHHNVPAEELAAKKSAAGSRGNHVRWHLPPNGEPSSECEHCRKEGIA